MERGVGNLDGGVGFDVAGGDGTFFIGLETNRLLLVGVGLDDDLLDVENDVRHVLDDARDGGELVIGALDADGGDGTAFETGQEDATKAVADGPTVAALERLDEEHPVGIGEGLGNRDDPRGQFHTSPSYAHEVYLQRMPERFGREKPRPGTPAFFRTSLFGVRPGGKAGHPTDYLPKSSTIICSRVSTEISSRPGSIRTTIPGGASVTWIQDGS